jgi:ATP-dependent Clp protease protease subunit
MDKFWKWVRNKAPDGAGPDTEERTLFLNGTIAEESWFDDDVTPALFKSDLESGKGDITVWINSPGGDCFAAAQIYNMLTSYAGHVTVKIDGLAASAASVIAMAGDTVLVSPVSMLMIHNPATMAMGDRADMQKAIEMLDSVKNSIINAYAAKTGLSRNKLSKLMDDETWMDANMAVELHFADEIMKRPGLKADENPKEEESDDGTNTEPDKDEPEKKASGMLFSSRQLAQAFTNKVNRHFAAEKTPEVTNEIGMRDADELQKRLDFLHSIM